MTRTISWVGNSNGRGGYVFHLTYDGRVLGDSRGYSTEDQAREAALEAVSKAGVTNGVRNAIYRPGYKRSVI